MSASRKSAMDSSSIRELEEKVRQTCVGFHAASDSALEVADKVVKAASTLRLEDSAKFRLAMQRRTGEMPIPKDIEDESPPMGAPA